MINRVFIIILSRTLNEIIIRLESPSEAPKRLLLTGDAIPKATSILNNPELAMTYVDDTDSNIALLARTIVSGSRYTFRSEN